jgi:hypothetical protein
MFVDINSKQVRVPRNLLVELLSELYWDSPVPTEAYHALLSRTVAVLGTQVGSPFRNRTVQEGETQTPDRPLTTAALYEGLRKTSLIGAIRKGAFHPGPLYEQDNLTALSRAVEVLTRYFDFIAEALPDHWARGNADGGYLCTNNGVNALLLVLEAVLDHQLAYGPVKPWQSSPLELASAVEPYVQPIIKEFAAADVQAVRQYRRQVGNAGQRQAAFAMMEAIQNVKPGFNPPGLDDYIKGKDQTGTNQARILMPELQLKVQAATLNLLRHHYGPGEDGWWRKGVPERVRQEVAARREASPSGGKLEEFFELIDYKTIAEKQWEIFQPFFGYGDGRSKESRLAWFQKVNEVRNRIAHPERGPVSDDELALIESVMEHFDNVSSSLPAD